MTEERLPLAELLAKAGDGDFLRSVAEAVVQLLMETDVEGLIGAGRHERSGDRTTYRNGYRDRTLDTRLGSLQLRIPKLRQGSYFPPFLEPRKTSEKALVAVIQEAWVGGVSTRRVDDLVQAMGLAGISKSTVSKLCKDIDDRVNAFLDRPLAGEWPYLWLDATYLKQREGGSPPARRCVSLLMGTPQRAGPPMDYPHKPSQGVRIGRKKAVGIVSDLTVEGSTKPGQLQRTSLPDRSRAVARRSPSPAVAAFCPSCLSASYRACVA